MHPPAPDADCHEADERDPGEDEHCDPQREREIHPAQPGRDTGEKHHQQDFKQPAPNLVWVGDITYVRITQEGNKKRYFGLSQ